MVSAGELEVLIKQISAPTLVMVASRGQDWYHESLEKIKKFNTAIQVIEIEGSHHLHLEAPSCHEVLATIRNFLAI